MCQRNRSILTYNITLLHTMTFIHIVKHYFLPNNITRLEEREIKNILSYDRCVF